MSSLTDPASLMVTTLTVLPQNSLLRLTLGIEPNPEVHLG